MIKLSDTQAVLLSSASQRANGSLLPLPASIAGGARLAKPIAGLLTRGFAEERETSAAEEMNRTDDDVRLGLFITAAGEAAIGISDAEPPSEPDPQIDADQPTPRQSERPTPRQTKAALVLGLLGREGGATLPELIEATGWLPHTTRAALTGLRKKGHDVQRGKRDGVTFYRVTTADAAEAR